MINLFLNNQRLLEQLLHTLKKENSSVREFGQDVAIIKKQQLAQKNDELLRLRNELLGQNVQHLKSLSEQGYSIGSQKSNHMKALLKNSPNS